MPADMKTTAPGSDARSSGERDKALNLVLGQIERNFGKGSIMRLGDASRMRVETISTGALTLDLALGGGYPKGRVVEIYGPESSGKTTLTLHAIAEVQKRGGVAAFVDAEHALDPHYAASLGVDVENLLVSQPDTGEMALEIVDQLVRSAAVDIVVIDSVAALTPRSEIEGEMGDVSVGAQARLMSQAMRKITGNIGKSGCTVIFLNQLRLKIGVMYGNPETTTGGNALKFYASVRLDIRRIQTLKKGTEEFGIRAKVKVAKNKVAPPFASPNSTSCLDAASARLVVCWILQKKQVWWFVKVLGTAMKATTLVKVVTTPSFGWSRTLKLQPRLKPWCVKSSMKALKSPLIR
jgi:recombination protein RecA